MKVLMLAQTYAPVTGGEERLVEDLSRELVGRGHEVAVATLRQPQGEPPAERGGVRIHLLGSSVHELPGIAVHESRRYAAPLPDPKTTRDLRRVLAAERPDVVHAHNWLVNSYLPLARRAQPPLVLSLHDYGLLCPTKRLFLHGEICSGPGPVKCGRHACDYYGLAKGTMVATGTRLSEPWVRRRADLYLPVSSVVAELCGVAGRPDARVVPNFVRELPPTPAAAELAALDFLPEGPFVFYFGDVSEDKGAKLLAETYAGFGPGPPPLVMVGRRSIEGLEGLPNVIAPGPLPHALAIEVLRRASFSVAPSIWAEPFGIVALEAGAAGKAVIASESGGLRDVVVDGETGVLVPGGDGPALAGALRRLLDDPAAAARMGAAARERIARNFSREAVLPMFEHAYEDAIAAAARRSPGKPRKIRQGPARRAQK